MDKQQTVSLIIIAFNEENYLKPVLDNVLEQDYPLNKIELILVDSASEDRTKELMEAFADKHTNTFLDVKVLDNPQRILPAGWNVALPECTGDIITRWDAHAEFASDFISSVVAVLGEGEDVCGGPRPTKVADESNLQELLLLVEESAFGASFAKYRGEGTTDSYVDAVFHGSYRREVFDKVGLFDERLVRTEDNDIFYRIRQAGYRIKFDPRINSTQIIRPTVKGMIKQKFANGFWIGKTLFIQPGAVGKHHLVPLVFVSALGATSLLALRGIRTPLKLLSGSYVVADLAMTLAALGSRDKKEKQNPYLILLPLAFPTIHVAYGIGTVKGIIQGLVAKTK
ncbi:MAG: glycosyltransferase family 2 protein [Arcanobacterium sp.]